MRIEVDTARDSPNDIRKVARLLLAMAGASNVYENEPNQPTSTPTTPSRNIFDLPIMSDQPPANGQQMTNTSTAASNALNGFTALFDNENAATPAPQSPKEPEPTADIEVY